MSWIEDIGTYLQTQGAGTLGTNIFYQNFDFSAVNSVILIEQAGQAPRTTLRNTMNLKRPELGVRVRNQDNETASDTADTIYGLLHNTYNTTIGSTRFKSIKAIAEPFFVSQSINDSFIYSINFSLEISE